MRKKLAALRGNGKSDRTSVWFKPEEGDTDVRIVPAKDGDPLKEVFFHYNIEGHRGVRNRYFSPVVVRGLESEGVKVYGYGKQAYELLLGYILDPEYGDITDPQGGTDITITYTKPTAPGAYPKTNMKMRRNTSSLLPDADAIPGLLQNMPDIDGLFTRHSPDEVSAILDGMLSGLIRHSTI
jgi:hypothetical protein